MFRFTGAATGHNQVSAATRVHADGLAWLQGRGDGHQSRMNAILRVAMPRAAER
ncbi:MAG: BrnA antitoxin family protein [Boseongicola sp. SB0673_bin_14]|nr:BrnA antitoxin family protein [Boseongicola sp. SB0667_bin_21]MYI67252.1 BrnA antitoxin family protein [Boseongicola sp. SB0673_bin_14]